MKRDFIAPDKSFVVWLDVVRLTDDPEGDLVFDLRRDRQLPPAISSLTDLRSHMRSRGACREALEAAPGVWGRYFAWWRRAQRSQAA
jgi:hypothetical protein